MMKYSKQFLCSCYANRFEVLGLDAVEQMYQLAYRFYDTVTREEFRRYCSLDAHTISEYKNRLDSI